MYTSMNRAALPAIVLLLAWCGLGTARACDTWVALSDATESRVTMLGKNSDRTPFDCQPLLLASTSSHGRPVRRSTLGAITDSAGPKRPTPRLGSSPYWCWGYEEGMNEFGVAIGNEGVFTKAPCRGSGGRDERQAARNSAQQEWTSCDSDWKEARQPEEALDVIAEFGGEVRTVRFRHADAGCDRERTTTRSSLPILTRPGCWRRPVRAGSPSVFPKRTTSISNTLSITTGSGTRHRRTWSSMRLNEGLVAGNEGPLVQLPSVPTSPTRRRT